MREGTEPFGAVSARRALGTGERPYRMDGRREGCLTHPAAASGLAAPLLFSPCTHYLSVLGFPDLRRPTWLHAPRVWNRIPDDVRSRVVTLALDEPELSPRELAVRFVGGDAIPMTINHLGKLLIGLEPLPLEACPPVLEEAPRPSLRARSPTTGRSSP